MFQLFTPVNYLQLSLITTNHLKNFLTIGFENKNNKQILAVEKCFPQTNNLWLNKKPQTIWLSENVKNYIPQNFVEYANVQIDR